MLRKQKKLPSDVTALAVSPHDASMAIVALGTGAVSLWKWKKGVFNFSDSPPQCTLQTPVTSQQHVGQGCNACFV